MSRASDYIAAVEAEGHKLTLHRGAGPKGQDMFLTSFYPKGFDVEPDRPADRDAAMWRTYNLRPRTEAEKQELRGELIKRGLVE